MIEDMGDVVMEFCLCFPELGGEKVIYDTRSRTMPRERPHSLRFCCEIPFSRVSCFFVELCSVDMVRDGSSKIAGYSIVPIRRRTNSRRAVEFFGASREAASTVTVDHFGGELVDTKEASGVQWRVVDAMGSGGGAWGVT